MIGDLIIALLAKGPKHVRQICGELELDYSNVGPALTACVRRGLIVAVGTAGEHGCTGVKANAPMYALPGTPPLKKPIAVNHTGLTERIREALARGPATAEELAVLLGEPPLKVAKLVQQLTRSGGIVVLYALYRAPGRNAPAQKGSPVQCDESIRVAQRITKGRGARWGAGPV